MHYKIWVYGTPFSGKSYFADTFPRPFVINTDGNGQFYKADSVLVTSYEEFARAVDSFDTEKYDTLIIDVLDHVYDMCREAFLEANGIEHESDYESTGSYGKGWTLLREQFWYLISSKVRNIPCNLVLISHDEEKEVKGKLGITRTTYGPATIPKKIVSKITGIMHFVGRCYRDDDEWLVSFGGNDNEVSGYRLPIEKQIISNDYQSFLENIGD